MFDWEDLRYFCAFAKAGSLAAAARLLGVDHATVARRISSLEKALELKLVDRRQRSYILTENGHHVMKMAAQINESAFSIERFAGAAQDEIKGEVIVTAPPGFVGALIAPYVGELYRKYPQLRLRLLVTKEVRSLSNRESDIIISLVRPRQLRSVSRKLGQLCFALYASADYLADGREHAFIAFDESVEDTPQQSWLQTQLKGYAPIFFSNDLRVQAIVAAGHAGVALLPDYLADEYRLVRVDPNGPVLTQDIWISIHEDVKQAPHIEAAVMFLTECIQKVYSL